MKKNYSCKGFFKALSVAVFAVAFSANAQEYRKSWDFTKWSAETVSNLKAANAAANGGAANTREWSDVEKSGDTTPTDISKDNCFWEWGKQGSTTEDKFLVANGTIISELEGLYYTETGGGALAIAVNYPTTSLGTYNGPSYLWFGGSGKNYFVIPHVAAGTEIKIGVESHKSTDARGIELYVGRGNTGTKLLDPDGNEVAVPTTYQDLVWYLPEEVADTPNEDGTYDLTIRNTNGCHLYYITVGDGGNGGGVAEEDKKIAVVSPDGEDDPLYFAIQDGFESTFVGTDVTLEQLQEYEAILVSNKVTADSPFANVLRSAVAYQPIVNLSAALAEAWGFGTVANTESNTITISDVNLENALFADLSYDEGLELVAEGTLPVVTPGAYLANDAVLATVGDAPYILVHNPGRNSHILIPFAAEAATDGENMMGLVANALKVAAKSKKAVTAATQPSFTSVFNNLNTDVTFAGAGDIYYTLDGTEPTDKSTAAPESKVLNFTEPATIKAIAYLDGYLPSAVTTYEVEVRAKANAPVISFVQNDNNTEISFSTNDEGVTIYYNFSGITDAERSAKYTGEPVVITEPATVYAFAQGNDYVASDLEQMQVGVRGIDASNIRLDVVAHFNANHAYWLPANAEDRHPNATTDSKTYYPWGKSGKQWSATEGSTEIVGQVTKTRKVAKKDADGNDLKDEDGNVIYEMVPAVDENGQPILNEDGSQKMTEKTEEYVEDVYANNEDNLRVVRGLSDGQEDWEVFSYGQLVVFENEKNQKQLAGINNGAVGYYYATAQDEIGSMATSCGLSMKNKSTDGRACAGVQTAKAFTAPFDFVTLFRNNGAIAKPVHMDIYISKDKKNWEKIETLESKSELRGAAKYRVPVEKDGDWYVRMMNADNDGGVIADCYILVNGELSKEYTGLEEVVANEGAEVISVEYFNINGMRIAEPETGFYIMRATLSNGNVVVKKIVK